MSNTGNFFTSLSCPLPGYLIAWLERTDQNANKTNKTSPVCQRMKTDGVAPRDMLHSHDESLAQLSWAGSAWHCILYAIEVPHLALLPFVYLSWKLMLDTGDDCLIAIMKLAAMMAIDIPVMFASFMYSLLVTLPAIILSTAFLATICVLQDLAEMICKQIQLSAASFSTST